MRVSELMEQLKPPLQADDVVKLRALIEAVPLNQWLKNEYHHMFNELLCKAVAMNSNACAKYLSEHKLAGQSKYLHMGAFNTACQHANMTMLKYLMNYPYVSVNDVSAPILQALQHKQLHVVDYLLDFASDSSRYKCLTTMLWVMSEGSGDPKLVAKLLREKSPLIDMNLGHLIRTSMDFNQSALIGLFLSYAANQNKLSNILDTLMLSASEPIIIGQLMADGALMKKIDAWDKENTACLIECEAKEKVMKKVINNEVLLGIFVKKALDQYRQYVQLNVVAELAKDKVNKVPRL